MFKKTLSLMISLMMLVAGTVCVPATAKAVSAPTDHIAGAVSGNMFTGAPTYSGNMDINSLSINTTAMASLKDVTFRAVENITSGKHGFEADDKIGLSAPLNVATGDHILLRLRVKSKDTTKTAKMLAGFSTSVYSNTLFYANNEALSTANGFEITDTEYQDYISVTTVPESYTSATAMPMIYFIGGTQSGTEVVISTDASDIYFGKEYAHDIRVMAEGSTQFDSGVGGTLTVQAEILNQLDIPGGLQQETEWIAYNADRTDVVEGITFTKGESGAIAVEIASDIPDGKYDLVAVSKEYGIAKSIRIQIGDATEEPEIPEEPEKPDVPGETQNSKENFFTGKPVHSGNMDINSLSINTTAMANTKTVTFRAVSDITSGKHGFEADDKMGLSAPMQVTSGDTLIMRLRVKSSNTSKKAKMLVGFSKTVHANEIFYANNEELASAKGFEITSAEYQDYISVTTVPEGYTQTTVMPMIYFIDGTQSGAEVVISSDASDIYFSKEDARDIKITTEGSTNFISGMGGVLSLNADVVNQLDFAGNLSQNIKWTMQSADQTSVSEHISVVSDENGEAVVYIAPETPSGRYELVAESEEYSMSKSVKITVEEAPEIIPYDSNLPYSFFDYEDGNVNLNGGDISVSENGIGGSAKAMTVREVNDGNCVEYNVTDRNGANLSGIVPAAATMRISFYVKSEKELKTGNIAFLAKYRDVDGKAASYQTSVTFDGTDTTNPQKVWVEMVPKSDMTITSLTMRFSSLDYKQNRLAEGENTDEIVYLIDDFCVAVYQKQSLNDYEMNFDEGGASMQGYNPGYGYPAAVESASVPISGSAADKANMQVVTDPLDSKNKVLKVYYSTEVEGAAPSVQFGANTGDLMGGGYNKNATATLNPGETITYTFRYYLGQKMRTDNNPGFSIRHYNSVTASSVYATGTEFPTEEGKWHTATLSYKNTGTKTVELGTAYLKMRRQYADTIWCAEGYTGHTLFGGNGTYGERDFYLDDFKVIISGENAAHVLPKSEELTIHGTFAPGNTVRFTHTFTKVTESEAQDNSLVRLVNETATGEKASLGICRIGDDFVVPELPTDGTLALEVIPIERNGVVGRTYVLENKVEANLELEEFAGDGSVAANVTIVNERFDKKDIHAVLVILLTDEDGYNVKRVYKELTCPVDETLTGEQGKLRVVVSAEEAELVKGAKAYLWDCGDATEHFIKNTTMRELVADCTVSK